MRIAGVMSGTSYDGIEVAAGEFRLDGDVLTMIPVGELSVPYEPGLRARVPNLTTTADLGVPPQAKEAYAFALLGWLSWHGLPGALPSVTGARRAAVLGAWTPGAALPPPAQRPPNRLRIGVRDVS